MNYADIAPPDGEQDNMGGTTQRLYFASLSTFLSIKKPVVSPATLAERVTIATAHTFKSTHCFKQGYCTMDKGQFELEPVGDIDGRSFKGKFKFFVPGNDASLHGFADRAKNDSFIFLIEKPDSETKGYIQVGTEMFPAKLTGKFNTATNSSGAQGYEFEVEYYTNKCYIYTGTVSLTPAV